MKAQDISLHRILSTVKRCAVIFLCASACASCYDLESVIDQSRKKPSRYGNDLYWHGYHIGKTYKTEFSDREMLKEILVKEGWWQDKAVVVPAREEQYYDSNGKLQTRTIPEKTIKTSFSATLIKDIKGVSTLYVAEMDVPEDADRHTEYFFVYDINASKMYQAGKDDNASVSVYYDRFLQPDLEPYKKAEKEGLNPFYNFKDRKAVTLGLGTEKRRSLVNMSAGTDLYIYKGLSNTAIVNKADTRLRQNVKPLVIAWANGDVSWNNIFLKGDFRYALFDTGSLKSGKEAAESLGAGKKSYLYDLAAGFHGLETKLTVQKWNFGKSDYYTSSVPLSRSRNVPVSSDDFTLEKRQLDLMYHFSWRDIPRLGGQSRNQKVNDYYLGYRYMSYDRPGIVYRYATEKNQYTGEDQMVVKGESLPQNLTLSSQCLGFGVNNYLKTVKPGFNLVYGVDLYGGISYGHVDVVKNYGESPSEKFVKFGTLVPGGTIGVQYNIIGKVFSGGIRLAYSNDMYVLMHPYGIAFDNFFEMFQTVSLSAEFKF